MQSLKKPFTAISVIAALVVLAGCSAADTDGAPADGVTVAGGIVVERDESLELPDGWEAGDVVIGATTPLYKPTNFKDDSGKVAGSHMDIFAATAARLGLEGRIEAVGSGGADIAGVKAGRYDMTTSSGSFAARQAEMDLVEYYRGGIGLLVQAGNPHGVEAVSDTCGLRVAVTPGVMQEKLAAEASDACVAAGKPAIEILRISDSLSTALASDRVDVAYETAANAQFLAGEQPDRFEIGGEPEWLAPNAFGFAKDNTGLRDAWRAALQSLVDDGTYQQILDFWNQSLAAVPSITINESTF